MGIQTMASDGSGGGGGGGQRSQTQNLPRQGSLYSLTLNEVQSQLGEPLHSMNLDDLVKSVFEGELDGAELYAASSSSRPSSALQRQGSSITMPQGLSKKTVDEIWKDIQLGQIGNKTNSNERSSPAFGEMTLEDFLVKAGVVADGTTGAAGKQNRNVVTDYVGGGGGGGAAHWLQPYQQPMPVGMDPGGVMGGAYPLSVVGAGQMLDGIYGEGQMSMSSPTLGALSDPQRTGRKRGASGDIGEKLVERRQKRMIKNRESAARSRARKQAYTNELENKVSRLEEENERLKKQKELDKILDLPPPQPKYQLRRNSSASF